MPARLALTPEQALERIREQTRLRTARWRANHARSVTVASPKHGSVTAAPETAIRGSVTRTRDATPPALPARHSVPPQRDAPPPPTGVPPRPAPLAVPKPNKAGDLIDLLRAAGVAFDLRPADFAAVKHSQRSAAEIAEVYVAIALGEFGDDWMSDRLNVAEAIKAWPGYQNRKGRAPRGRPPRSESPEAVTRRVLLEARA